MTYYDNMDMAMYEKLDMVIDIPPESHVLDVGAGRGVFETNDEVRTYTSIDRDPAADHVICAEADEWLDAHPGTYDTVILCSVLHEVDRPKEIVEKAVSAVKPGGQVMVRDGIRCPDRGVKLIEKGTELDEIIQEYMGIQYYPLPENTECWVVPTGLYTSFVCAASWGLGPGDWEREKTQQICRLRTEDLMVEGAWLSKMHTWIQEGYFKFWKDITGEPLEVPTKAVHILQRKRERL